jgi:hypothetical protein
MLRKLSLALVALFVNTYGHAKEMDGPKPGRVFSLGVAGVATPQPNRLFVAAPLANLMKHPATDVKIDKIVLASTSTQTPLPLAVGTIPARSSVIVQAEFSSGGLVSGQRYELVLHGTYRGTQGDKDYDKGDSRRFRVHTSVVIPPPSEGSGQLGTTQLPPHKVEGGKYPPQRPRMDEDEVNAAAPPVPTNPDAPGTPTPTGTEVQPAPIGDPPAIRFDVNNSVGISGAGQNCSGDSAAVCAEPSGASGTSLSQQMEDRPSQSSTRQRSSRMMQLDSAAIRSFSTHLPSTALSGFCKAPDIASPWLVRLISGTAMAPHGPIGI